MSTRIEAPIPDDRSPRASRVPGRAPPTRGPRSSAWPTLLIVALAGCADGILDASSDATGDGDPCRAATEIALGDTGSGDLGGDDCQDAGSGGPTDRWRFALSQAADVRIDLSSTAFDAFLELREASGHVIAMDDDGGPEVDARIVTWLPPGTYTVVVRAYAPGMRGGYQLRVAEAPDCSPMGAVAPGDVVAGAFGLEDCLFQWGGLAERWSLSLAGSTRLRLGIRSPESQVAVVVEDPSGGVYGDAVTNGPGEEARLDLDLPAGSWIVSAVRLDERAGGTYELEVGVAPPCGPGTDLTLGETMSGDVTPDDCRFDLWSPADSFSLTLTAETQLHFQLKSPDFAPLLVVRDQDRRDVAVGWDDSGTSTARARVALPAGTYAVFAVATGYPEAGSYELSVTEVDCGEVGSVAVPETVEGGLDAGDCQRANGAFRETWSLVLGEQRSVRLDLHSDAFDPFLVLQDASGAEIARDDDGGPGLDARLERTLAAGTYRIITTSFGASQVGPYTLSVADAVAAAGSAASAGGAGAPSASAVGEPPSEEAAKAALGEESRENPSALLERIRSAHSAPSLRGGTK